uniref:Uncharacterized protein LOC105634017 n=1 Tax=Rhizophora mucronata TaxID=61149 RepID=A0A2P2J0C5_RHIMU
MDQQEEHTAPPPSSAAACHSTAAQTDPTPPAAGPPASPPPPFDPSRMIGIIKRKALIKELAAVYHNECLHYCRELLELQNKHEEPFMDLKAPDDSRKEPMRPSKRAKKPR